MAKQVKYKIERRMIDVSKWWQFPKVVPRWCLVEYGTVIRYEPDPTSLDLYPIAFDYEHVLIHSDEYTVVAEEHISFSRNINDDHTYG